MKKITIILSAVLLTASVFAQTPEKISYQAVVRNADNNLVTNSDVGMQISILQGSATGTTVYTETQKPTTNANGLVTIEIGTGTTTDDFSAIDWARGIYFIKTETDPSGGTDYTITGTSQLLSVPYALHAKTAESVTDTITETDPVYAESQASNITASDITNLSNLSGTNTGDQDISGLATQSALEDTSSAIRNDIPDVSGFISSETDPVYIAWDKSYNDLINKPTITDTVAAVIDTTTQFVRTESQNLSDVLALSNDGNGLQIKNIANPTDNQDVVTKSYLDSYTHGNGDDNNLVLWNKLGSETEVLNSEIGENGELVGPGNNYEPAKFGNGYVRTDVNSYIKFPSSVLEARRTSGTIEFWVMPKVTNPVAFNYGAYMLVGYSISGSDALAFVRWGDGITGLGISGGVNFDGTIHKTPEESQQFVATVGEAFHIALVWDVNGIDGTAETIRIYRGDSIIGTSTDTWDDNATTTYDHFYIGTGPDSQAYNKYIMDNIKVWNYAKTDYSDMDTEHQTAGLYTAGTGIDITNNVISATNEIQLFSVSAIGDTLYLSGGNWVIIPGISAAQPQPLTDYDGNVYQTVTIGNQEWMAENLKVTHYPNGTAIPLVTDNTEWKNLSDNNTDDAYCYYNNNTSNEINTYGALYTWAAAMGDNAISSNTNPSGVQGVCPDGWHLPSDEEWKQLEMYLGMSQVDADSAGWGRGTNEASKLAGNSGLWTDGSLENDTTFGTSGFSALPSGYRDSYYDGSFYDLGDWGYWWSSTEGNSSGAYRRTLSYDNTDILRNSINKSNGFSVRCIGD